MRLRRYHRLRLHALGYADAQQAHGGGHGARAYVGEAQAQRAAGLILFAQHGAVVIELVVLLHQVVGVVRYDCRRV